MHRESIKFFEWCPEDVVVQVNGNRVTLFPEKLNFLELGQDSFTMRILSQPGRPSEIPKNLGCTVDVKIEVPMYYLEREVDRSKEVPDHEEYTRHPHIIEGLFTLTEERLLVNTEHFPIWEFKFDRWWR